MGVVRREGNWRLNKTGEGAYEITFQKETEMRIFTSDALTQVRNQFLIDPIPVREVDSYTEVEGLFEEQAHGPPPLGMEYSSNDTATSSGVELGSSGEDLDISEVPPLGIAFAFLAAGAFAIYTFGGGGNTMGLLMGVGLAATGLFPIVYAGYLFRSEDWKSAWEFLITVDEDRRSSNSASDETEKTPPAPKKLKNTLIFDRADQQCEWCGEHFDHPHVHHIKPRREDGPNEPANLIVLCPNCHEKADREAIPRSKLKAKVKRLPEVPAN